MTAAEAAGGLRTEADLTEFLTRYPQEMAFGDEQPELVLDRWFVPGVVIRSDGVALDRRRLIDHARPARRNARALRVAVHSAMLSGNGIAAHYTLEATMRTGRTIATEIYLVGRLGADGRVSSIDQCTRVLTSA